VERFRQDPLLIGGLGGSGTRVFSRIARHGGRFMGSHVDPQEDATPFWRLYHCFARRYLEQGQRFSPAERTKVDTFLDSRVRVHLAGLPGRDQPWGVKNPRSIFMLPYWAERFPGVRFLHIVRNGLDMAYSANTNQLRDFGDVVLRDGINELSPARAILFWQEANRMAADFGECHLPGRYRRVRLEDLCADPAGVVDDVFAFIGAAPDDAAYCSALAEIRMTGTLGRWRDQPTEQMAGLARLAWGGLERFGYAGELTAAAPVVEVPYLHEDVHGREPLDAAKPVDSSRPSASRDGVSAW
jgi:sulfotransferase family protein